MKKLLGIETLERAVIGGLVMSAGGSGMGKAKRIRMIGETALNYGSVRLVSLDELDADAQLIVATGVGAPGFAKSVLTPRDAVESARLLLQHSGHPEIAGVLPGHVPGPQAWLQAAVLGIPLVDAATNGRGHPTVKMGGMGLASRPDVMVTQAGVGGASDDRVEILVRGGLAKTSAIMRAAAMQNGGVISATRGPFSADMVRRGGAPKALSFTFGLGEAMLALPEGPGRIRAAIEVLRGRELVNGIVSQNTVAYASGFDVGKVVVEGRTGRATFHIYNEFMAADIDGERVSVFPDLMAAFDAKSGESTAISEMPVGRQVVVIHGPREAFPVGAGAIEKAALREVEEKLGFELSRDCAIAAVGDASNTV